MTSVKTEAQFVESLCSEIKLIKNVNIKLIKKTPNSSTSTLEKTEVY